MHIEIISYNNLLKSTNTIMEKVRAGLYETGIIGISDIPEFTQRSHQYIQAARQFARLPENIKQKYAPNRDAGDTEGYELGAEWFKDENGEWQIDDKKSSFYAMFPNHARNKWPAEVDLKTSYLAVAELMFSAGKKLINLVGLNEKIGIPHHKITGYARMLHYHQLGAKKDDNSNWCGAHFDHGIFTALLPAYYFCEDTEVTEPEEAGLYIFPTNDTQFKKVPVTEKNILLFQVGEFGQLASNDEMRATQHLVKRVNQTGIERYTFALFYNAFDEVAVQSKSILTKDARYVENCLSDGSISYGKWGEASYARYRAVK